MSLLDGPWLILVLLYGFEPSSPSPSPEDPSHISILWKFHRWQSVEEEDQWRQSRASFPFPFFSPQQFHYSRTRTSRLDLASRDLLCARSQFQFQLNESIEIELNEFNPAQGDNLDPLRPAGYGCRLMSQHAIHLRSKQSCTIIKRNLFHSLMDPWTGW